jgi:hypothetical protein
LKRVLLQLTKPLLQRIQIGKKVLKHFCFDVVYFYPIDFHSCEDESEDLPSSSSKPYKCSQPGCTLDFYLALQLKSHMRVHNLEVCRIVKLKRITMNINYIFI